MITPMKSIFLISFIVGIKQFCIAQNSEVAFLPTGKYETVVMSNQNKWEKGDIILLENNHYMISTSNVQGTYKFSVTAQRIFFTTGPLNKLYAKTIQNSEGPEIILPVPENEQLGIKLPSEVRGYYRQ